MYVDKIQKKKNKVCSSTLGGTKQMSFFKDNRISQINQHAKISQMQAIVGTRTLGFSGSSGNGSSGMSAGVVPGNTTVPVGGHQHRNKQIFNPEGDYHKLPVHAHLLFDNVHQFPNGIANNNIGYGGHGLFSEVYDYKTKGHVLQNENLAHLAVLGVGNAPNAFNVNGGAYDLFNHNCQCYTMEVFNMYHRIAPLLAVMMTRAYNLHNAALGNLPVHTPALNLIAARNNFQNVCVPLVGGQSVYSQYINGLINNVPPGNNQGTVVAVLQNAANAV